MPFVQGFLRIRGGGRPDHDLPGGGEYPDAGLPEGPGGEYPSNELPGLPEIWPPRVPVSPPGVWPPGSIANPIEPAPPGTPPGTIWPPPPVIGNLPATPPGSPPVAGNLPTLPSKVYWMIAYCPALGWKYVAVDPSLRPQPK